VERRERLRGLQWRIDQARRNRSPLSACIYISNMMWDHLLGPNGLCSLFADQPPANPERAKILPFTLHQPKNQYRNLP
jgi:hypothetical protein